jgi:hypothetical protein
VRLRAILPFVIPDKLAFGERDPESRGFVSASPTL